MSKFNKTQLVKEYLEGGNSITSLEAFTKFGCTRLAAIIFRLRKQGMNIETKSCTVLDRYSNLCTYSVYSLVKE